MFIFCIKNSIMNEMMCEEEVISMIDLTELLKKQFQIEFSNPIILKEAFTHSSYVNEHRSKRLKDNERLEFLGDAVIELAVSNFLFQTFPDSPEGILTKMRSSIVREASLSHFAKQCQFDQYVLLGKGEEAMNGRNRSALLEDLFEAFVGALFLDQGMGAVVSFLEKVVFPEIEAGVFSHGMDYKTELQEYLQREGEVTIQYHLLSEEGPAHQKEFSVEVSVEGHSLGTGVGRSKKNAEQHAAKNALMHLRENT